MICLRDSHLWLIIDLWKGFIEGESFSIKPYVLEFNPSIFSNKLHNVTLLFQSHLEESQVEGFKAPHLSAVSLMSFSQLDLVCLFLHSWVYWSPGAHLCFLRTWASFYDNFLTVSFRITPDRSGEWVDSSYVVIYHEDICRVFFLCHNSSCIYKNFS